MDLARFTSLDPAGAIPELQALFNRDRPKDAFGKAKQRGWYRVENLSEAEADVYIYDHIGEFGVTADEFVREFSSIRAAKITVRINSPGGAVFDGFAIYNAIRRHTSETVTMVDGIAASSASFIALAGDRVVMAPHSQLLIHDAHGLTVGDAADMREMADMLDKNSDNIASVYANKTGGTIAEWRERMKATMLISDSEAVELGLADEIDGEEDGAIAAHSGGHASDHAGSSHAGIPSLTALREGTENMRKNPLPDFDFVAGVREALIV